MHSTLHFCTSNSWGGLELYACTLMEELSKAGCSVHAVCKPRSKVEAFLTARKIPCIHLPSSVPFSFSSQRMLRSFLQQQKINVLHVHFHKDIWPASLALRSDTERALFFSLYMGTGSKDDWWHRFIFKRVNGFFASSKIWCASIPKIFAVPQEKVHLLPYGRDLDRYHVNEEHRKEIRSSLKVQDDEFLVGTMVRIDPAKGALDFVESYRFLDPSLQKKVKYVVIGEPTRKGSHKPDESPFEFRSEHYLQQIQRFIAGHRLEKNILLAGFQDDVIGYLGALDVFVFPSRNEMFSLVMLDAMGMSLPLVASREGGNLEQVEDGVNGILYDTGVPSDLAGKLSLCLQRPELRQKLSRAARQYVENNHDMKQTIARLMQVYQSS